ncbi:UDP-N-acetylmuramoylalanyl-D-glutamate--2,6-diaminopimelate ligase [Syntrophobotulus glycolicus DSM 8271]|uniref:UDP-N-acetylmuramoyl-L-alanyl-D-glutamate--2,6-diaminopimelate ligase n=1 Tax=Syntrophobotulus glycolicus (strain DSM 8271 / FlGlyR) TaxID=645991 RepID=F0SZZ4_SYNGF|nr:UDP-N-acetylmuramoylalanyl-D-glutamate--2,6-diaminopimelate ligase [Syntrophobotulus glycolicus DSM 8271]
MRLPEKNNTLQSISDQIAGATSRGNLQVGITGAKMDSRKVIPGDIYICIPGFHADGHDFAEAAVKAGAAALAVERYLPLDVPQIKVRNIRQTAGKIAAAVFGYPSQKLELIGVTGTNGKTTVTHLIESIAQENGKKTGLIGTLGSRIGNRGIPGQHTTPESAEIQDLLNQMVEEGVNTAVMEVSSHALDLGRIVGCRFDTAIFTNLTQDHLDYHQSMEEYLAAKGLLFAQMSGEKPGQKAILNADDQASEYLMTKTSCRVVTYGIEKKADYQAEKIVLSDKGIYFDLVYKKIREKVFFATPGKFSVYNVLAAYAWALDNGYESEKVQKALCNLQGVPGRFQSIRKGQPFLVIIDYAHTPDGLENVLSTAREITGRRLITVFGCGGDRDRGKRPLMAEAASGWSDYVIVTSDNPRTEDPEKIIGDILPGMGKVDYEVIVDRRRAIHRACTMAGEGDTVLIAGKGHEDYQIIGTSKIHFDDKEEASAALRSKGYAG